MKTNDYLNRIPYPIYESIKSVCTKQQYASCGIIGPSGVVVVAYREGGGNHNKTVLDPYLSDRHRSI